MSERETEFERLVYEHCECTAESAGLLAMRFEVSVSTVRSWSHGRCLPHPTLQRQILSYISR